PLFKSLTLPAGLTFGPTAHDSSLRAQEGEKKLSFERNQSAPTPVGGYDFLNPPFRKPAAPKNCLAIVRSFPQ
ncbi:MAG: hypothetical protein WCT12_28300, partial [Verrucomicrobiota bacterium]